MKHTACSTHTLKATDVQTCCSSRRVKAVLSVALQLDILLKDMTLQRRFLKRNTRATTRPAMMTAQATPTIIPIHKKKMKQANNNFQLFILFISIILEIFGDYKSKDVSRRRKLRYKTYGFLLFTAVSDFCASVDCNFCKEWHWSGRPNHHFRNGLRRLEAIH